MPDIISRREAVALNRKRFYTGRLCKYGHDSERYTTTGNCIACANPKLQPGELPPPLEQFRLANGRVVELISQEQAHSMSRPIYFTGQPCNEGHMAERNTKSGRCLECMHPTKYGPDAFTSWWPFQPKPPLRVPPKTPLAIWHELAKRLQSEIPKLVAEIEAEQGLHVVRRETALAYGMMHVHDPSPDSVRGDYKLWYPYVAAARGHECPEWMRPEAYDLATPWVEHQGHWYALLPSGESVHIAREGRVVPERKVIQP